MSAMVDTKTNLSVEIAEPIRQIPHLLAAVQHATEYLRELLDVSDSEVDGRELAWGCSDHTPPLILAHISEWDRYGRRQSQFLEKSSRLLDPGIRDYLMSRLMSQLHRERFLQIGKVIDRGIKELEQEEEQNGHAD